jgi:cytochrome c peroxidase
MEVGDGNNKTFALRGVKDNPPYMHDGRLLTLDDTVEFFNLVLADKPTKQGCRFSQKMSLSAFRMS